MPPLHSARSAWQASRQMSHRKFPRLLSPVRTLQAAAAAETTQDTTEETLHMRFPRFLSLVRTLQAAAEMHSPPQGAHHTWGAA